MWFKVDDNLATHPKVLKAGNAAMGLWVRAGAWCAQHLSDGHVPSEVVGILGTEAQADALVVAGLWIKGSDGFDFHEWNERQPSRADAEERRAKNAEKLRKWRERNQKSNEGSNSVTNSVSNQAGNPAPVPVPVPVPTSTDVDVLEGGAGEAEVSTPRSALKRGTRIPDPFMVTKPMRDWATSRTPLVDVSAATERFVNYWRAKSGKDATKLDWIATWRNWLLRDQQDIESRRSRPAAVHQNIDLAMQYAAEEQKELSA